jgi:nucleoside-diphosphate-sugar epimerase
MRTLVTGGTGFVGVPTVRRLVERGDDVHVLGRHDPGPSRVPGATYHEVDLLEDPEAVGTVVDRFGPEQLAHLAWTTTPGAYWGSLDNLRWVRATLALYEAFVAAGGRRAVVAGTCAEYDWSVELLSEATTPLRPQGLYGTAKHAAHELLEAAAGETGVPVAWARLFSVYGPGEQDGRLVPSVLAALRAGEPALVSEGSQVRDFLHVDDAARALVALLDGPVVGAVNVASGLGVPVKEVVATLAHLEGRADLVRYGARPAPASEPARLVADVGRLRDEVGFRPRFDLSAGLRDTVDAFHRPASAATASEHHHTRQ